MNVACKPSAIARDCRVFPVDLSLLEILGQTVDSVRTGDDGAEFPLLHHRKNQNPSSAMVTSHQITGPRIC